MAEVDPARVQVWLDDAEVMIRAAYPECVNAVIDQGDPDELAILRLVECTMVRRVLTNPRGIVREQVGDTSASFVQEGVGGMLVLSPADLEMLDRLCGVSRGLASVALGRADLEGEYGEYDPATGWEVNAEDPP
jgi:hypothetical protein